MDEMQRVYKEAGSRLLSLRWMERGYRALLPLGRLLARGGVSPNALTWGSFIFAAFSGILVAKNFFLSAGVAALLSGLFDVLDGMTARLEERETSAGAVLDSSLDRYADFFLLAGAGFHFRRHGLLLFCCFLAIMGSFMVSYSTAKAEAIHVHPPRGSMKRTERWVYLTGALFLSGFSARWLEPRMGLSTRFGAPLAVVIILIAFLSNVSAARRLIFVARQRP